MKNVPSQQSNRICPSRTATKHINLNKNIKLLIKTPVVHQLLFMAAKCRNNEWSGVLFYKVIGDFTSGDFALEVVDIYLMAEGSRAYVEFETSPSYIKYLMEDLSRAELSRGLVHSHNTMSTFFSGTDTQELEDNSTNHNYYLSLIVNNYLDATARICFRGEIVAEDFIYTYINDLGVKEQKIFRTAGTEKKKDVLFYYNCTIYIEQVINVPQAFTERVEEVKKAKEEAKNFNTFITNSYRESDQLSLFGGKKGKSLGDDFDIDRNYYGKHNLDDSFGDCLREDATDLFCLMITVNTTPSNDSIRELIDIGYMEYTLVGNTLLSIYEAALKAALPNCTKKFTTVDVLNFLIEEINSFIVAKDSVSLMRDFAVLLVKLLRRCK